MRGEKKGMLFGESGKRALGNSVFVFEIMFAVCVRMGCCLCIPIGVVGSCVCSGKGRTPLLPMKDAVWEENIRKIKLRGMDKRFQKGSVICSYLFLFVQGGWERFQ